MFKSKKATIAIVAGAAVLAVVAAVVANTFGIDAPSMALASVISMK